MPNATIARGNYVDTNDRDLTQTLLDAAVLEQFYNSNVLFNSQFMQIKPLEPGTSSHDFKIFGDSPEDGEHHVPGAWIESGSIVNAKVNVAVDDPLIKALRLDLADEELSKFPLIEPYARTCARKNAEKMDKRAFVVLTLAARTAAVTNVHPGGNVVERVAATIAAAYPVTDAGAGQFALDASTLARQMDEDDVPDDGNRYMFISPYIRQVLTLSTRLMNRDYVPESAGNIVNRVIGTLEGFKLVMTQHIPSTAITTDLAKYNGDFTAAGTTGQPAALALYNADKVGPIGCVQVGGMVGKIYFDENRDCWLVKHRLVVGMGIVSCWCAGEIRVDTS